MFMSQAFTLKKTIKVNELKKNCWNSVCRVFQTKSKLLTWRFVAKRATKLTSATTHRDSYGQEIYDTLSCLLKRRTNRSTRNKILRYTTSVLSVRTMFGFWGLAVWIFVRWQQLNTYAKLTPSRPDKLSGDDLT